MAKKTHPSGKRPRTQPHDGEDAFVAHVLQGSAWAKENSQALILGGVALVVVVASVIYYVNFQGTVEEQATAQLEQIQQTVGTGQTEAAKEQLATFLQRFGDTDLAAEGRLILADLHLESGNPQLALDVIGPAADPLRRAISIQAGFLEAAALEELDRWEEAAEVYVRVANAAELEFQINDALASAARIQARLGEYEEAATLYEELLASLEEGDPGRGEYELRLAEVRAAMDA